MLKEERQALSIHMIAGMMAGGITRLTVAPLDVLKIRFQVILLFDFSLEYEQNNSNRSFIFCTHTLTHPHPFSTLLRN
jgi:hypothetical protein